MIRKMVQLTEKQAEAVRRKANAEGISESEVVRRALDRDLSENERRRTWDRALGVVGKHRDREGKTDVAVNHDKYLAEAYLDWRSS